MAPAAYYAAMVDADYVVIDTAMRYDRRRKEVHRTIIDGAHGPVFLTVPVGRPQGRTWNDVAVSDHGRWWNVQQSTLATLFGATPYFNYYRHDICRCLNEATVGHPITDLDIDIDAAIRRLLGITARMSVTLDPKMALGAPSGFDTPSGVGGRGDVDARVGVAGLSGVGVLGGLAAPAGVDEMGDMGKSEVVDMRRVDFYAIDMPAELYPGRSILRALFELGADELRQRLGY